MRSVAAECAYSAAYRTSARTTLATSPSLGAPSCYNGKSVGEGLRARAESSSGRASERWSPGCLLVS